MTESGHRYKQKLWRTKYLAMIIGIGLSECCSKSDRFEVWQASSVNRTLGFLLLLLFSIQLVSQELNENPSADSSLATKSSSSSSESKSYYPTRNRQWDWRGEYQVAPYNPCNRPCFYLSTIEQTKHHCYWAECASEHSHPFFVSAISMCELQRGYSADGERRVPGRFDSVGASTWVM